MAQSAAPTPNEPITPRPHLTLVQDQAPDAHVHTIRCSPLHGGTSLAGRIVTDPAEVAAIRRRVEAHAAGRGAWRRALRRIRSGR